MWEGESKAHTYTHRAGRRSSIHWLAIMVQVRNQELQLGAAHRWQESKNWAIFHCIPKHN